MPSIHRTWAFAAVLLAAAATMPPAIAKPDHAGGHGGGHGKHGDKWERKADKQAEKAERKAVKAERKADKAERKAAAREVRAGAWFAEPQRVKVRSYYARNCPPGLAKKNNGCMPPGQAKQWAVGQPLPAGVVVYSVPRTVLTYLPPQPVGYRYVRVASDILLIAIGTQLVMDGISGLM